MILVGISLLSCFIDVLLMLENSHKILLRGRQVFHKIFHEILP